MQKENEQLLEPPSASLPHLPLWVAEPNRLLRAAFRATGVPGVTMVQTVPGRAGRAGDYHPAVPAHASGPIAAVMSEMTRAAAFRAELRRFLARTETVAVRAGLTPRRYDLLLAIALAEASGGVAMGELAATMHMRQTAMTELVNRAEASGLIERRTSPDDGRVRLVRLTPEGTRRLLLAFSDLRADRDALWAAFYELDRAFRHASPGDGMER